MCRASSSTAKSGKRNQPSMREEGRATSKRIRVIGTGVTGDEQDEGQETHCPSCGVKKSISTLYTKDFVLPEKQNAAKEWLKLVEKHIKFGGKMLRARRRAVEAYLLDENQVKAGDATKNEGQGNGEGAAGQN